MAIADDFSVDFTTGNIRHVSGSTNYTVLELHRYLQALADDAQAAGGANDDILDIASKNPSIRVTDEIITLVDHTAQSGVRYNIDDNAAKFLYGGSITQGAGATQDIYSGLRVLGSVVSTATQIMVVQDKKLYQYTDTVTAPFWGTQASPYNGNVVTGVLFRVLIKSRQQGADIDQSQVLVIARNYGDTYAEFAVTLGTGEAVAAVSSVDDPQNDTAQGTVTAYTHVINEAATSLVNGQDETFYDNSPASQGTFAGGSGYANSDVITLNCGCTVTVDNQTATVVDQFTVNSTTCGGAASGETLTQISVSPAGGSGFTLTPDTDNVTNDEDNPVGGYTAIDIGDGNGAQPYYSSWTFGADTSGDGLKGMWEFIKDLIRVNSGKNYTGIDGHFFRGVTHTYTYDNLSGTFREGEEVVWGTRITYDTLAGGTFTVGNYVRIGTLGAAGRIMADSGTVLTVALEDTNITLANDEVITEYGLGSYNSPGAASGVTAAINVTILNNAQSGGSGLLLAVDTGNTEHHIQVRTGSAPVDNLQIAGVASGATADVAVTVTAQTIPTVPMGSYVGSLIGAFGFGVDTNDLSFPDTVQDLDGDTNNAPNNVTFTINGPDSGNPDRLLVGPYDAAALDFDWDQMTLNDTGLNTSGVTSVTVASIPVNTPSSGWLRITLDDGRRFSVAYTSYTGAVFTIPSTDFTSPNNATTGNNVMVAYLDKDVAADPETYVTVYTSGPQTIFVRLRDGGSTPIQPFEGTASLGSGGGSITVARLSDT